MKATRFKFIPVWTAKCGCEDETFDRRPKVGFPDDTVDHLLIVKDLSIQKCFILAFQAFFNNRVALSLEFVDVMNESLQMN
jgi:hypothetical protein